MNRRRFVRVQASLRFTFEWEEPAAGEGPQALFFELFRTVNLSAGGCLLAKHVVAGQVPGLGARGECAFNIDSTEIRVQAQVVHLRGDGFSVRFIAVPQQLEDKLVAWVFRHETMALRKRRRSA